jgi:hypothetical protein
MSKDDISIKKKNHYVWAHYLRGWSDNKRDIWYLSDRGKVSKDSTKGICMIIDFYKIPYLTKEDVLYVYDFISEFNPEVSVQIGNIINDILNMQKLVNIYKRSSHESEYLDKASESMFSNPIEDMHSAHEDEAMIAMEELRLGKVDILKNDKIMMGFVGFIAQQMSRTLKVKNGSTLTHLFPLLSYFYGLQLGHRLFFGEFHFFTYENKTNNGFITSSHPVINISEDPSKNIEIYFPLSPRIAFGLSSDISLKGTTISLSVDEVNILNQKVCKQGERPFVGQSSEQLYQLKKDKLI